MLLTFGLSEDHHRPPAALLDGAGRQHGLPEHLGLAADHRRAILQELLHRQAVLPSAGPCTQTGTLGLVHSGTGCAKVDKSSFAELQGQVCTLCRRPLPISCHCLLVINFGP